MAEAQAADGKAGEEPGNEPAEPGQQSQSPGRRFGVGLARAFGGAILFNLPLLMTQEMWALGFTLDRARIALFVVLALPFLVSLSWVSGFEETFSLKDDIVDALVAFAVGVVASVAVLALFGVVVPGMTVWETVGPVALLTVPGAVGALLAQSQLGGDNGEDPARDRPLPYFGELFVMVVGAVFFAFNIAPTEEVTRISAQMNDWQRLALVLVSLALMHAFVYAVEFRGNDQAKAGVPAGTPGWMVFLRFTVVGYALVLLVCGYLLWTFGRADGTAPAETLAAAVTLAFPASLGAAAARLIL